MDAIPFSQTVCMTAKQGLQLVKEILQRRCWSWASFSHQSSAQVGSSLYLSKLLGFRAAGVGSGKFSIASDIIILEHWHKLKRKAPWRHGSKWPTIVDTCPPEATPPSCSTSVPFLDFKERRAKKDIQASQSDTFNRSVRGYCEKECWERILGKRPITLHRLLNPKAFSSCYSSLTLSPTLIVPLCYSILSLFPFTALFLNPLNWGTGSANGQRVHPFIQKRKSTIFKDVYADYSCWVVRLCWALRRVDGRSSMAWVESRRAFYFLR